MQNTKTTILLATYNGSAFLDQQIQSFADQDLVNLDILVSDDGSTDGTDELLIAWAKKWSKGTFTILKGPAKGFAENFRFLIQSCPNDKTAFVAFCDQDDIWHKDKLHNAIHQLNSMGEASCSMYCSRTRLVDVHGTEIGFSPLFVSAPSFTNALTQSLAGGNTIVLNHQAFDLVQQSAFRTGFFSHDWWCYQLLTGAGGQVYYDSTPQIDYRQHDKNIFGRNSGFKALSRRISGVFSGEYSKWIDQNLKALRMCSDLLTDKNIKLVTDFQDARQRGGISSVVFLWRNGIKRQKHFANIGLYVSQFIRK